MDFEPFLAALDSGDDDAAEGAVAKLAGLAGNQAEAALPVLAGRLADPDPEKRWWAVRALAAFPGSNPDTSRLLGQALGDEIPDVRQCAALGLRSHPDPELVGLLALALADPDPLAARLAADAMIAIGEGAVPALIEALQAGPHPARLQAVRALAKIKDTRSIPALIQALDHDSALTEYWASLGLERMGVGMSFFIPD